MLKVIKPPSGLCRNPLDGFSNGLETKIAKILMRSLHNSKTLHANLFANTIILKILAKFIQ